MVLSSPSESVLQGGATLDSVWKRLRIGNVGFGNLESVNFEELGI